MSAEPGAELADALTERSAKVIKEMLEAERKETAKVIDNAIERAIHALKSDLEREQQNRERAESSKNLDRWTEWSKRWLCAVAGGAICFVLFISVSECSDLHNRITTLELKK